MSQTIYIADYEQDIREILTGFLENAGYEVESFETGDELFASFRTYPCELVILDIIRSTIDGMTICKKIRSVSSVPIIIITDKDCKTDKMKGLTYGGDDYLTKPFSPMQLVMRVAALLRLVNMQETSAGDENITYGDVTFSSKTRKVTVSGNDAELTMMEVDLLSLLLKNQPNVYSRSDLLEEIWDIDSEDINTSVVDETVRRIKAKLKLAGSNVYIKAMWGFGYKLEINDEKA